MALVWNQAPEALSLSGRQPGSPDICHRRHMVLACFLQRPLNPHRG
jgi:hypothetical protein